MARQLDQIIVIDVESTCWEKTPPTRQESEIIEIGICMLDIVSGHRMEKESILVKPEVSTVSEFCTQLTTLTQEQVEDGTTFNDACSILKKKYLSKDRVWASYGDYDRRQFERQCHSFNVTYPFGPSHLNIKNLFAILHGLKHEVGMAEALNLLNIELEGVHHRAADDAWNIASILSEILIQRKSDIL